MAERLNRRKHKMLTFLRAPDGSSSFE